MVMAGVGDRGMGAEATRGIRRRQPSPAGLVLTLDVTLELCRVEVHLPQVARAVPQGLVVEVGRRRIAALPAGRDCQRADAVAELHHGHEAVAAGAVPLLRTDRKSTRLNSS